MKSLKERLDSFKDDLQFIGHKQPSWGGALEFGDGPQRTGTAHVVSFILFPSKAEENALILADQLDALLLTTTQRDGSTRIQYVRHTDKTKWYGKPWCMSRDNFEPLIRAASLYAPFNDRVQMHLDLMLKLLNKRFGFTWNYFHIWHKDEFEPKPPDNIFAWNRHKIKIRAKNKWWLWPLLCLYDLDHLINSIFIVIGSYKDKHTTSNDLNHQLRLVCDSLSLPTPTLWLSKMIYRLRPTSAYRGTTERLTGVSGAESAFLVYYNDEKNHPPMTELWFSIAGKFL